jgi:hypothetical protein
MSISAVISGCTPEELGEVDVCNTLETLLPAASGCLLFSFTLCSLTWAAAVVKWTHPLVTVQKVRDVAGDIVREQEEVHAREAVAPTHS